MITLAIAQFDVNKQFVEMKGQGEIWLGADGLPLRQIVSIEFAPDRLQQVNVQITTDFSAWGKGDGGWGFGASSLTSRLSSEAPSVVVLLAFVALISLVIRYRRSPVFYRLLVSTVIASMLLTPLVEARQLSAFSTEQGEQRLWVEVERQTAEASRDRGWPERRGL